jgi:hypothetical protein
LNWTVGAERLLARRQCSVDFGQLVRQRGDVVDHEITSFLAHAPQVVVAGRIDGHAKIRNPGTLDLPQRARGILDAVLAVSPIGAVVVVLG